MRTKITFKESIAVIIIISLFVFGFLYCTGTLLSGYHLVDDHEFYTIGDTLKDNGLWKTMGICVKNDFQIRFRPLYYIERVLGVALFGAGTFRWSCMKALEIIMATYLLYIFVRSKGENKTKAILFAALCVWGPQTAIWWRLGPQESFGIFLFSLSLNATWQLAQNRKIVNRILFIIFLMLLSMQKESFMVCIPAFFILLFAFDQNAEGKFIQDIKNFIKKYVIEIITLLLCLIIEVGLIFWRVGLNQIGYAGFSSQDSVSYYFNGMLHNLVTWGKYPMLLVLFAFVLVYIVGDRGSVDKQSRLELLFCFYIWGIQLLVYAKSGMWERYLIPWMISVAYFVVLCVSKMLNKSVRAAWCIMLAGILLCIFNSKDIFNEASIFTTKGNNLGVCAEELVKRTDSSVQIYGVSNDLELDDSFGVYMQHKYGYEHYKRIGQDSAGAQAYFGKNDAVEKYFIENNIDSDDYDWIITESYEAAILREIEIRY